MADRQIQVLENQTQSIAEHIDLENRGRRKNVRVIGLPEDAEGSNPTKFLESWIPNMFGLKTEAGHVKAERVHCMPALKPRPQPILIRFHNFADKQRVFDVARQSGNVRYREMNNMFFCRPWFFANKGFDDVKKHLRTTLELKT